MDVWDINKRLFDIIDKLIEQGVVSDYKTFGENIDYNKNDISHLRNNRKKVSVETLFRIKKLYNEVNLDYIIMGDGDMFIANNISINNGLYRFNNIYGHNVVGDKNNIKSAISHVPNPKDSNSDDFIDLLRKKDEQIDRLLSIIERTK